MKKLLLSLHVLGFYCYWLELMALSKPKRAHKTISIDQKIQLLYQINKKSYTVFCEEFGIRPSTISDIKKRESQLRNYKRNE